MENNGCNKCKFRKLLLFHAFRNWYSPFLHRLLAANEDPVEQSILLCRDSDADNKGIEKYSMVLYDTPEGKKNQVNLYTRVLNKPSMVLPHSISIGLREFHIEESELPVYSISDHLFVLSDGTKGQVELFDGFFKATFNGEIYDSDYVTIKGIHSGDLSAVLKKDQPIWPEFISYIECTDLNGTSFVLKDDKWEQVGEEEETEEDAAVEA